MYSDIYWITGPARLAIMARPRAGDWLEDEVAHWAASGVETVVSLLEPHEEAELGLEHEADLCRAAGVAFVRFPVPDRGTPANSAAALELAGRLAEGGGAAAIHCRAGIGRSAVMAALVLVRRGMSPTDAFDAITAARGVAVPDTEGQRAWVETVTGSQFR